MTLDLPNGFKTIIDDDDYGMVRMYKWQCRQSKGLKYVGRGQYIDGKVRQFSLHRQITECPKGMVVDHVNGDGLDNRRENLRICTQLGNNGNQRLKSNNSTGYKGVSLHKMTGRFQASITKDGKATYLGLFDSVIDAAMAYDAAANEYFKDYRRTNFGEKTLWALR